MNSQINQRLYKFRQLMSEKGLDACIVYSADPHLSEYLPEHWQTRQWLSGFNGSAGTLVITQFFAGIWTDSRYWEQAKHDLEQSEFCLMQAGLQEVPTPAQWLCDNLETEQKVFVNGQTISVEQHESLLSQLEEYGIELIDNSDLIGGDLFDALWSDRPSLPEQPIYIHKPPFACRTVQENLENIRNEIRQHSELQVKWHVISALDEIAWLFNLRGSDVPYNPVFLAYAIIGLDSAILFVDETKMNALVKQELTDNGIQIQDYAAVQSFFANIDQDDAVLYDPARTTVDLAHSFADLNSLQRINPIQIIKSQKNDSEIENIKETMRHDGAALCEFFAWLESALADQAVDKGLNPITELTIDEKITAARAKQPNFVSPSFATIAGFNANGAMPHYQATQENHAEIKGDGLLLIDSGGQYLGGTTDITRVVPIGNISDHHKDDFTLVLKGMIALSQAQFPLGTKGAGIDAIARLPLWQNGLDFGHGTGHGVGYFLNVHEGPQSISPRIQPHSHSRLLPGMVTSNEPGLYRAGKWGIRIENLVLTVASDSNEFGDFLKFETLTLCPIDTRCINTTMLTRSEKSWLNQYHDLVREKLSPLLTGKPLEWLRVRTAYV